MRSVFVLSAAGFALAYGVLVRSTFDRRVFEHVTGGAPAPYRVAGGRTLQTIDVSTIAVALVVLTFLALARGHVRRALVAAIVVVAPVLSAEVLKRALPFPAGRPHTFPSGHTAVAVSLGLAAVIAAPPLLRVVTALAGAAYAAAIGFAVVVLAWHYPSDAVGSFFLCGLWVSAVALAFRVTPRRPELSLRGVGLGVVAVGAALVAAAWIAARHPAAVAAARSAPAIAALAVAFGLLSLAFFAVVTPLLGERLEYGGPAR